MVSLEQRSQHPLTGNAHESAAHCSSWRSARTLLAVDDLVADQSQGCQPRTVAMPLPPRHDRSFGDRKGSLPSGRFFARLSSAHAARGRGKERAHASGTCSGSSDRCDARPPRPACPQRLRTGSRFQDKQAAAVSRPQVDHKEQGAGTIVLGRLPVSRTRHFATAGGGHAGRNDHRLGLARKYGFAARPCRTTAVIPSSISAHTFNEAH
jgi:hypothetical protein